MKSSVLLSNRLEADILPSNMNNRSARNHHHAHANPWQTGRSLCAFL